ncbi:alpha-amylase family glycosyl hydrolase [Nonomuraea sp. NPDC050404]|uniref:alpha-amylase family glycosyl hydrolase n=1 Tax=Nonomuraea sp. NPDC050404 TaxID=3155783 RepID=UPI0033EA5581
MSDDLLPDVLSRRESAFLLWRPAVADPAPRLVIGRFQPGNPPSLADERAIALVPETPDLWTVAAASCELADGQVYHYWYEVTDSRPGGPGRRLRRTDPFATTVDWRLLSPPLDPPYGGHDRWPAAVIMWRDGRLVTCDPGGQVPTWAREVPADELPPNNQTVYYKLPAAWSRRSAEGGVEVAAGTFRDVMALVDQEAAPANFRGVAALAPGRSHLGELGATTLELTPAADSWTVREWGYATSNYFAPDHDLGFPRGNSTPTPNGDLAALTAACHRRGIRVGYDAVMAFGQRDPYREINYLDFHVREGAGDPEEDARSGFGGDLFKYNYQVEGYDPVSGKIERQVPARQYMKAHIAQWILRHHIDSIRIDSVNNVYNWDFVQEFTEYARALSRAPADRFLVVGEELSVPIDLVRQRRLDALWNERFKHLVRQAILGEGDDETVRCVIDGRRLGFEDGAQMINYVTSHDVEGFRNERLYDFLNANGVRQTEERVKLAFACLLTAVGIPMILAGEEFADRHDLAVTHPSKQVDPVNYDRMEDPWRRRVFTHVSRLVKLRRQAPALAVNDTAFIHTDLTPGRRVMAWRRGGPGQDPVIVVANFSGYASGPEYVVHGFPEAPWGSTWREVTQDRVVPPEWAGREPVYPWEAKVYALE